MVSPVLEFRFHISDGFGFLKKAIGDKFFNIRLWTIPCDPFWLFVRSETLLCRATTTRCERRRTSEQIVKDLLKCDSPQFCVLDTGDSFFSLRNESGIIS